jgi:uncharacterized protein (DUF1810 family)
MGSGIDSLERFVQAQDRVWDEVVAELSAGRKTSHWMWFVFPQLQVLGRSSTAKFYGLAGADEARSYLAHPVLGPRLVRCCERVLASGAPSAVDVFGEVDAMKFRSCLTLFGAVAPEQAVFAQCLRHFYAAGPDPLTLAHVARS